jgi:hypothetical protein
MLRIEINMICLKKIVGYVWLTTRRSPHVMKGCYSCDVLINQFSGLPYYNNVTK